MSVSNENPTGKSGNDPGESSSHPSKIDRTAPAGSKNSLGAQSVRDGRPATDDSVVEAMDEEGPGVTPPAESTTTNR